MVTDTSTSPKPNVLLIVMDTARADRVLNRPDIVPNVHSIANEGCTFEHAYTTGPWTLPSHASMFTGQYTSDHGTHAGTKRFDPDVTPLAARLRESGYQTIGISNNTWVSSEFGFDRGFEEFLVGWELFDGGASLAEIAKEREGTLEQSRAVLRTLTGSDGPKTLINALYSKFLRKRYDDGAWLTNRRIKRWFENRRDPDRPFFMFVNYLEPHLEYDPPTTFRNRCVPDELDTDLVDSVDQDAWAYMTDAVGMSEREFEALGALYDGELHYLDHRIGRVYEHLENLEILDETVVIVVGDHGENIGDHELMDHQYCLYDSLLHVPLIVRFPDEFAAGTKSDELVELRDLFPTILSLTDLESPNDETVSTNDLSSDIAGREHVMGEYVVPQPSLGVLEERFGPLPPRVKRFDRGLRSVRTKEWKYIERTDGTDELYDVETDSAECENVASERPGVCEDLATRLEETRGELSRTDGEHERNRVEGNTRTRLEDLGYLQ